MGKEVVGIMIFAVVILAIVLGLGNDAFQRWLRHREKQLELMADKTAEQAAQYASKAEKLEQRVRVLERIATDTGADLAAQIEDLRNEETENRESVQ